MNNNGLIFNVEDKPKFGQLIVFAIQQVLAIMAATIAVPTIIGLPTQIPSAILGAGVGTLVYIAFTKGKSPVFLGSSFAFINSLGVAMAYGYLGIIFGSVLAGLVYVIIALIVKTAGTEWVSKLMPPVVIGPTVAIIGLSLAANAAGDMVKASASNLNGGYNLAALGCALVTFFTVVICSSQKKRKMPKLIPFIIGIVAGYAAALVLTVIGKLANVDYLMILDWSPIVNNFVQDGKFVGFTSILDYPDFAFIEGIKEIITGETSLNNATVLNWTGAAQVALAFIPVALVVFAEHIADHKNLSSIIGRDLLKEPGLHRTLLGDGVGSMAGTIFGICPNTTYGESVACVAITGNASVRTILTTAILCIGISFFRPLMVLLETIPSCVMGGVCLTLYGFIAVSGLKMFKDLDLGDNKNLFVVSAILIAGIGGLSIQIPYQLFAADQASTAYTVINGVVTEVELVTKEGSAILAHTAGTVSSTIQITSIATALILGIVTNIILSKIEKKSAAEGGTEQGGLISDGGAFANCEEKSEDVCSTCECAACDADKTADTCSACKDGKAAANDKAE
ncbi:MAG TPA: uracil-xanthine permease [Clostridiales bacterium]|nr:uracil-xanthine permease [Clostridiales bacterium]